MCCYDSPLMKPKKGMMKDHPADHAIAAMYKAKLHTRAAKGAALARAKRVGTKRTGEHGMSPFGGG